MSGLVRIVCYPGIRPLDVAARHLLETTALGAADAARRCGLGTAETLPRAFVRHLGVPPSAYREQFAVAPSQKGSS